MKLHVLTLTWNGLEKLERLQVGLGYNLAAFKDAEWHIRDNGSNDGTVETVKKWNEPLVSQYKTIVHDIGHNRDSFAQGVNYLFDKANPADDDVVVLLNNDVELADPQAFHKMHKLMQKTNAGVVGARLLYSGTDKLQHAGVIFGPRYGKMPYHFRHGEKSTAKDKKDRYFQAVTAAVCMIKASSFRRVGGMNLNLRWAFEDVDMCLKIGQQEKIAYCGDTKIYHEESASLVKNPVNKLFLNHNVTYFKNKWFGKYDLDHEKYLADPKYNEIK